MFKRLRKSLKRGILIRMLFIGGQLLMHTTVERVSSMHKDEILIFMNEIKNAFRPDQQADAEKIQTAVSLVRRNAVLEYIYNETNRTVTASIQSDELYTTHLSFAAEQISCSCASPTWCAHRIAVIFHLYLQYDSLTDWISEWKRTEAEQMKFQMADRTPAAWRATLNQLMNPIRIIGLNENPAVFTHKFSLIDQKAAPLYPFEWEWKPVFNLYYRLHALEAAWPYLNYHLGNRENSFSYGKWYVKNWLTEQFRQIEDAVQSLSSKRQLFEIDPFYADIRSMVRSFTIEETGLFTERFRLYRTLWQSIFAQKAMREKELAILEVIDEPTIQPLLAFFHIIEHKYEALEEAVSSVTIDNMAEWLPLANVAEYEDEVEALSIIMHALLPFIPEYTANRVARSERSMFARRVDGLLEVADFPEEEREQMFFHYGQSGVDIYADFLVERERFKEWAALMHRYRVPYEIAEAGGLKLALKEDPAAALPLLHLYATKLIEERNRQSYRRAVNIFKKMKNGAKKAGKHEFWNQYLNTIRERNRRLRALIEEIEKGNLTL